MSRRITDARSVQHFRALAAEFCAVIEQRTDYTAAVLLRRIQPLLSSLLHAALSLPAPARAGPLETTRNFIEVWEPLYTSLAAQLGEYNYYRATFDPYRRTGLLEGSLADDLADMYLELNEGVQLWAASDAARRRSIVWEWRFGFENHWGHHAINATRAIHALLYVHRIEDPEHVWPPKAPA